MNAGTARGLSSTVTASLPASTNRSQLISPSSIAVDQIEELVALREVGEVGAVDVGDVGIVVGLQAGGHLLQHPVGVDPARVLGDDARPDGCC